MTGVVRLVDLTKDYGRHRALDGVNLEIAEGEVFGYLGPNGAGKTTTIRLLLGLLRPTQGRAEVFGLDSWRDSVRIHVRLGYLPGEPGLYERRTGQEVVDYFAGLRGNRADREHAAELAGRFDLDLSRRGRTLSRGNKQKLAIVQAFMSRPDLVVLDEPTSGLDPLVQQEFHHLLREVTGRGGTVLLSSHVLGEIQEMAGRVGIIRHGRLVAVERLGDLRAKALHQVEVRLAGPLAGDPAPVRDALARLDGARQLTLEHGVVRCALPRRSLDALVKVLAGFEVADVAITEADLASPAGYLNTEFFAFMGPLLVLVYAIGGGAAALAGEEDRRTLDLLLANPVSRARVVVEKFAAQAAGVTFLMTVLWVALLVGGGAAGMDLSPAFYQYIGHDPLQSGLSAVSLVVTTVSIAGLLALAVWAFRRRDILG